MAALVLSNGTLLTENVYGPFFFFFTPQHHNFDSSLQQSNFITCCSTEHVQDENSMHYSVTFYLLPEVT